jgi:hypothetical protein
MEQWSNNACLGYVIKGLREMGMSEDKIWNIVKSVRAEFDWITVEEAADIYNKSPY